MLTLLVYNKNVWVTRLLLLLLRNVKKYVAATGFTTKRPGEEEGAIKREFTRQKTLDVYNENDINEFSDRVKQNPKDVEANYHLGVIRFKEEDFLQSQKYFYSTFYITIWQIGD